jgi:fructuronate reductase
MRYVAGRDEGGRAIKVDDPLAGQFAAIAEAHRDDPQGLARALIGVRAIFGDDLAREPRFIEPITTWLAALHADGATRTVAKAVGGAALNRVSRNH